MYGKSFFVCSLVTTSLSCDRQSTALADGSQPSCPDMVGRGDGCSICSTGADGPSCLLCRGEFALEAAGTLIACFTSKALQLLLSQTEAPCSSSETSMFSGSDWSELSYPTRLMVPTGKIPPVGCTQELTTP